jgi:septum site-determining protein MinC
MAAAKHHVTIKGVKDGLVFLLSDQCDYKDLIRELRYKLETTHQNILTGPIIHVQVKLGKRIITDEQKNEIRTLMKKKGNLIIQTIESEPQDDKLQNEKEHFKVLKGIVRSGQSISHDCSLLYIGDINPGGTIISTGDIYILGSLRGMAHAGAEGNQEAVIAASHLRPTQLRIADIISRPPDEWGIQEAFMEFAYLHKGAMEIDKIHQLHRIRPEAIEFKGE